MYIYIYDNIGNNPVSSPCLFTLMLIITRSLSIVKCVVSHFTCFEFTWLNVKEDAELFY